MLDKAFEALKTYDWGGDHKQLSAIDDAIIATHGDAAARAELEKQLVEALKSNVSRYAKDFLCRRIMQVGTAAAVPALAELLADANLSHMARFALERIPAPEAAQALRDAVAKVANPLKVGLLASLGSRRDAASVALCASLLGDADAAVARAAALALGTIRNADSAKAVKDAKSASEGVKPAVIDAQLANAEGLLAAGNKAEALGIYKSLVGEDQPKQVRLAATRGMLACAGKKE